MALHRFVNVDLSEAKRLADLYGIEYDLRACSEYCDYYLAEFEKLGQPGSDHKHLESFSISAFVKYARCFKGGVRVSTEKELTAAVPDEFKEIHELILDIRDKYIAHSINDLENHEVRVWLNPEERGKKINNVNIGSDYLAGPEPDIFLKMKTLVAALIDWIKDENTTEQSSL